MRAAIIENGIVTNVVMLNNLSEIIGAVDGIAANIGDTWDGVNFISPPPPPPAVPETVTRRQAKQALAINGKLSLVQPAIDAIPDAAQRTLIQIEWDDSQEFQRNRASVIGIGTAIGLTSSELDDLFRQAVTL